MGAWNYGSFDNDDALDWVYAFEKEPNTDFLERTLCLATDAGEDYLEANDASKAIAAAEVVAALRGAPHPQLPSQVRQILDTNTIVVEPNLVSLALAALTRVRTDSELKELWEEGDASSWFAALDELERRLKGDYP